MKIIMELSNLYVLSILVSIILWLFRARGIIVFYVLSKIFKSKFGYVSEFGYVTFKLTGDKSLACTPNAFVTDNGDYYFQDDTKFIGMHDRPYVPCDAIMKVSKSNVKQILMLDDSDIYDYLHEQFITVSRYVTLALGGIYLCYTMLNF